jgi:hypothetical protein
VITTQARFIALVRVVAISRRLNRQRADNKLDRLYE